MDQDGPWADPMMVLYDTMCEMWEGVEAAVRRKREAEVERMGDQEPMWVLQEKVLWDRSVLVEDTGARAD